MRQIVLGMRNLRLIRFDLPKDLCALGRKGLNDKRIAHGTIATDRGGSARSIPTWVW